jgi:hypothetical protein
MRNCFYIAVLFLFGPSVFAQLHVAKPIKTYPKYTNFYVGGGVGRSVLFLERNVKENNDATGFYLTAQYGGSKLLRLSADYTQYRPADISPTWYNIKANTMELNLHVIARFNHSHAFFYPLAGLSYNRFKGYFTGRNDYLNLAARYPTNTIVATNWLGLNIGTGYEYFYKNVGFYAEYKMRVGANNGRERRLNIMDVCYSFGLKFKIRAPSIYTVFKGTRGRYHLHAE